ncbi:hypothetical protein PQX77_006714, partial [Marasmius sp. AFHP31]
MERLDDTVPSLVYTPADAWEIGGVDGEYNSTTHGTRIAGARMQFIFTGTGIDVYGTKSFNMSTAPATNRFTIDGGNPVTWSASPNPDRVFNTSMFSTRGLSEGTHALVMEVTVENSETWIDYLQVVRMVLPPSSTPTTASTPGTQTITKTFTVSTPSNGRPITSVVPRTSPTSSSTASFSHSTTVGVVSPITVSTAMNASPSVASTAPPTVSDIHSTLTSGTIAGVSIGGTLAVVLVVLCLLFCLRRRKRVSQAS